MNNTHNFIFKSISGINSTHMLMGLHPTLWNPDFKSCLFPPPKMSQVSYCDFSEILSVLVCISHILGNPSHSHFLCSYPTINPISASKQKTWEEWKRESFS